MKEAHKAGGCDVKLEVLRFVLGMQWNIVKSIE